MSFFLVQQAKECIEEEIDEADKANLTQAFHSVRTTMGLYSMGKCAQSLDGGYDARKSTLYQTASVSLPHMMMHFGCDPDTITTIRRNPRSPNFRLSSKALSSKKIAFRLAEAYVGAYLLDRIYHGGDPQGRIFLMCLTVEYGKLFHSKREFHVY